MAKRSTESTAVNQLIELVATSKPLPADPSDDLMFSAPKRGKKLSGARMTSANPTIRGGGAVEPLPRSRAPQGTAQQTAAVSPQVRVSTARPARAVSIPPLATPIDEVTNPGPIASRVTRPSIPPPPLVRPSLQETSAFHYPAVPPAVTPSVRTIAPATMPVAAPFENGRPFAADATAIETRPSDPWEREIGTQQVVKPSDVKVIAGKVIGPMIVLVVLGVFIGGYFAFDGDGGKPREPRRHLPAQTEGARIMMAVTSEPPVGTVAVAAGNFEPVQAPEPVAAEPVAAEPAAPVPPRATAFVDVRIDSKPAGATVMLVDRGKTSFLGTTPVSAAVDPARRYELVFTYPDRATRLEAFDPSKTTRVAVALARMSSKDRKATAMAVDSVGDARPAAGARTERKAAKVSKPEPSGLDAALDGAIEKPAKPSGEGVLMVSSKPPCEIVIDGKSTGLTTPQRSITLPAGAHKVTLVNAPAGIKKTIAVKITRDQPTKLIQDFMK